MVSEIRTIKKRMEICPATGNWCQCTGHCNIEALNRPPPPASAAPSQTTIDLIRAHTLNELKHSPKSVTAHDRLFLLDEISRLRAIVRVNGLRWGHSHEEIDAMLKDRTP